MLKTSILFATLYISLLANVASAQMSTSSGTQTTSQEVGYVFVYAPSIGFFMGPVNDTIMLNNKPLAKLGTESFFRVALEPGKYSFRVERLKQGGVVLQVKANETQYLKLNRNNGMLIRVKGLEVVPAENAAFDLPSLKTMDKKRLFDPRATSNKDDIE